MIFSNKVLYKGEILFTKYIPIIISLLYLGNTLSSYYYKEIPEFSFLGGTSFIIVCRMYWSSYTFKLCEHHRAFLHFILVNNIKNHNQENEDDFTRNVIANLVSGSFSRYKK